MRILLMTDMEGSAGIVNHDDWVMPEGRYYDLGRRFLTREANAAIAGFFEGGAASVDVIDGHGAGGLDVSLLDSRAVYLRGTPGPYPFGLEPSHDGIAWVGQHAKAGAVKAHIAHTGWFDVLDFKINGVSVGEFGIMAFAAQFLGVAPFFGSGDAAFCSEAEELVPNIITVSVKEGLQTDSGGGLTTDEYRAHNLGARHLSPKAACKLIRETALAAARELANGKIAANHSAVKPPFVISAVYRTDKPGERVTKVSRPSDNLVDLLNCPFE
ncbi:MAG: M55 family metallopeptidase [Clostridiales bacterium]|jgi:D-amino peptidase|nr:M55 family metallopeptidase [Clostridiales bacterium]